MEKETVRQKIDNVTEGIDKPESGELTGGAALSELGEQTDGVDLSESGEQTEAADLSKQVHQPLERGFLEEMELHFGREKLKPEQYSALALAYIGDAVYDLVIRTLVLREGNHRVNFFHKKTSSLVKAEAQAQVAAVIQESLSEEENRIFHHGRNAKSASSAKNASIQDYRIATGLEALIGYLYLKKRTDRAISLIKRGLEGIGTQSDH